MLLYYIIKILENINFHERELLNTNGNNTNTIDIVAQPFPAA